MFYGKHKVDGSFGFFVDTENCTKAVELSDDEYLNLLKAQENGKRIIPGKNGRPTAVDPESLLTADEKKERAAAAVRASRDALLLKTDILMLADCFENLSDDDKKNYKNYRQYLRDIPQNPDFPNVEVLTFDDWL